MDIHEASFSSTDTLGTEQAQNVDLGTEVNDGNGSQDMLKLGNRLWFYKITSKTIVNQIERPRVFS